MLVHTSSVSSLLTFIAAAATVAATPIVVRNSAVTLPLARRVNATGSFNLPHRDQARVQMLKQRLQTQSTNTKRAAAPFTTDATSDGVDYTVSVGVGSPPTYYELLVDTGSSTTWVGAGPAYVQTNSSQDTGETVTVYYENSAVTGEQYSDTVTIGDLVIPDQSLGVASALSGISGDYDGVLGLGPVDLTEGTTSSGNAVPTVLDTAYAAGLIDTEVLAISFEPTTSLEATNGALSFGGVDDSKYTGEITYTPFTSTYPASAYVGIDQSIAYGSTGNSILSSTAGIIDSGTTLTLIPSDAFAAYQAATGAVVDDSTGLLSLTADQFSNLESLYYTIGDATYEFTPNAQIWPRSLNTAIGGTDDGIYLIIGDMGYSSGQGLDFINGMTFLERFYYVYDVTSSRVGFATTSFTNATTN